MELKELTQQVLNLFGADNTESFTDAVKNKIFSDSTIYEKYEALCPDKSIDWLQKIYQFYCADRKEKKQDYTPVSLSKLVAAITSLSDESIVYDSCCGSGSLLIQKWNMNKNLKFQCEELDSNVIPILLFNLCFRNIDAVVLNKDILTGTVYESYRTVPGTKYASIQNMMFPEEREADISISNPPFNLRVDISNALKGLLPSKYTCNFAFVANAIAHSKRYAAIILPCGVQTSKNEMECRKYFVEKGWMKAVITIPDKMFESTSIPTCILLLDKEKKTKDVRLINATGMKTVEIREQRGEGDASHYNRIYKKEFNTFSDLQIAAVCNLLYTDNENISINVSYEELVAKNYSFNIGNYLEPDFDNNIQHRDFNAIIHDINRIIRERNVVKVSVNKVWAEKLGLTSIILDCEKSNEVTKGLNRMLSSFKNYEVNEKIIEDKYIQSSNSKVFVIENTDKEILSSIMPFFMNMYKQHIFYLNLEENRLLTELRDALLTPLLHGDLEIEDNGTIHNTQEKVVVR